MAENKKTLLFSVLGVILLLVVVIGVSYAMYTFSAQGSKVNQITTGTISVSYEETSKITLTMLILQQMLLDLLLQDTI